MSRGRPEQCFPDYPCLTPLCRVPPSGEPLKLRMIQIQRLVVSGSTMRRPERLRLGHASNTARFSQNPKQCEKHKAYDPQPPPYNVARERPGLDLGSGPEQRSEQGEPS